jgi:hypothetical protein
MSSFLRTGKFIAVLGFVLIIDQFIAVFGGTSLLVVNGTFQSVTETGFAVIPTIVAIILIGIGMKNFDKKF